MGEEERTCTLPLYHLGNLSEDDAWSLFKRLAFKEDDEPSNSWKLEVGKEIVKKCAQVPLAIKVIGSLLSIKDTEREWLHFKNHDLVSIAQEDGAEKIIQILRLSYNHLPLYLRPCFAYCSIYPKDYRMYKGELISLWIAQGFVKSDENQNLEDIGELYFMDLLRRSFFQEVENDELGDINICKMHDLIHDLAQHVAGTECSSVDSSRQRNVTERTHHVSCELDGVDVISQGNDWQKVIYRAKKLRTFIGTCDHSEELKQICWTFKRLRALVVRNRWEPGDSVPDCMHKLKHLRYLHVRHSYKLTYLSRSITRLPNLQTLILFNCHAFKIPSDIDKLINLRHLELSNNRQLTNLPSSITRLQNLQTLKLNWTGLVRLPEDIGELVNLRHLDISHNEKLSNLPSSIDRLQNLRTFLLFDCRCLKELPRGISQLVSLRHLNNGSCSSLTDMGRGLGQLTGLRTLKKFVVCKEQEGENGAGARVSELKGLNNLEGELSIERLERVSHAEIEQVILNCEETAPPPNLSTHLLKDKQHLKSLALSWKLETGPGCNGGIAAEDAERLLEGLRPHPNLEQLSITSYGGVKMSSWIGQLPSLQSLRIQECKRLTGLSAGFRHLTALETLKICNCEELDLSDDYNGIQFQGLNGLSFLEIHRMPKLASLPVGLQQVTTLQSLRIYGCDNLLILPYWIGDFTSLRLLSIAQCPKLTSLPAAVRRLRALKELEIMGCPQLEPRCRKETGQDWPNIAHIPRISIPTYSPGSKYEKVLLKVLTVTDNYTREKAFQAAFSVEGVLSATIQGGPNEQEILVRGKMDPRSVAMRLSEEVGSADIISIGPAVEEEKE